MREIPDVMDLVDAAKLIPMKQGTLRMWLSRHRDEFPPRYRRGRNRNKIRVLTEIEVDKIRLTIFS